MLKSLYSYDALFPGTLSFSANELFLDICKENESWHLVSTPDGILGCIPSNFVVKYRDASEDLISQCVEKALNSVRTATGLDFQKREMLLSRLKSISAYSKSNTNHPEGHSISKIQDKLVEILGLKVNSGFSPQELPSVGPPKNLTLRLIDCLRLGTNCGFTDACATLKSLTDILCSAIPVLEPYACAINYLNITDLSPSDYSLCTDYCLLHAKFPVFNTEGHCSKECFWRVSDTDVNVVPHLDSLLDTLRKADPKLISIYINKHNLNPLQALIKMHQIENNISARSKYLQVIGLCCTLDYSFIRFTLYTTLPFELLRDLSGATSESDTFHLSLCLRLLSLLFSRSEDLPTQVFDMLTPTFFGQLLKICEPLKDVNQTSKSLDIFFDAVFVAGKNGFSINSADTMLDVNDDKFHNLLRYSLATFFLACNWHMVTSIPLDCLDMTTSWTASVENPLLKAFITEPARSKFCLELLIQAFNRDLDPLVRVGFRPIRKINHLHQLTEWTNLVLHKTSGNSALNLQINEVFKSTEIESSPTELDIERLAASGPWIKNVADLSTEDLIPPKLPAKMKPNVPHQSVVKLLCDIYSHSDTANLVYWNDEQVTLKVIVRQIMDSEPASEKFQDHLTLLVLFCLNSKYVRVNSLETQSLLQWLDVLTKTLSINDNLSEPVKRAQNIIINLRKNLSLFITKSN